MLYVVILSYWQYEDGSWKNIGVGTEPPQLQDSEVL